jgi:hypothetical protein
MREKKNVNKGALPEREIIVAREISPSGVIKGEGYS